MYSFDSRIRYSEVDSKGTLNWLALMDYFQDCSVFHSESLHIGVDYLADHHLAFFSAHSFAQNPLIHCFLSPLLLRKFYQKNAVLFVYINHNSFIR